MRFRSFGTALLIALTLVLPAQARFLSVDPVPPDAQTGEDFNRYAYASNSPYVYVDPDGRIPLIVPIIFGVTAYLTSNNANAPAPGEHTQSMSPQDQINAALPPGRMLIPLKAAANAGDYGRYTGGGKFSKQTKDGTAERANGKCEYCGAATQPARKSARGVTPPGNEAQTDHIVPRAKGGSNSPENAAHACRECNSKLSDTSKPHPRDEQP